VGRMQKTEARTSLWLLAGVARTRTALCLWGADRTGGVGGVDADASSRCCAVPTCHAHLVTCAWHHCDMLLWGGPGCLFGTHGLFLQTVVRAFPSDEQCICFLPYLCWC
jgi:hypothetical protein